MVVKSRILVEKWRFGKLRIPFVSWRLQTGPLLLANFDWEWYGFLRLSRFFHTTICSSLLGKVGKSSKKEELALSSFDIVTVATQPVDVITLWWRLSSKLLLRNTLFQTFFRAVLFPVAPRLSWYQTRTCHSLKELRMWATTEWSDKVLYAECLTSFTTNFVYYTCVFLNVSKQNILRSSNCQLSDITQVASK